MSVAYIDAHKDEFGVEPICAALQIAPSTYYAANARVPSARALRDAVLLPMIMTMWVANYRVYGVHKMWKVLHRCGEIVGRDQVARLMRELGIQGVRRGKQVRTTRPDGQAERHPDLVDRAFVTDRPNALWVTDLTYVPTWSGVVYVCFIVSPRDCPSVRSSAASSATSPARPTGCSQPPRPRPTIFSKPPEPT